MTKYCTENIRALIKRNNIIQVVISMIIFLIGLIIILYFSRDMPRNTKYLLYLIGGIMVIMGTGFLLSGMKRLNISNEPLIKTIEQDPRQIVWFYSYMVINRPFGVRVLNMASIFIFFKNGSHVTLRVEEEKLEQTMKQLRRILPHASVGYSIEKEQLYKADPELLYDE